jgi:hypothetical protein
MTPYNHLHEPSAGYWFHLSLQLTADKRSVHSSTELHDVEIAARWGGLFEDTADPLFRRMATKDVPLIFVSIEQH